MSSTSTAHVGGGRADRFVRKLFRLLRSRTQRHNQHLWPFVRIWRDRTGVISGFRAFGRSLPLTPLAQGYDRADETVHLILSGPSVAQIPYDQLDIRVAMGVNGAIALARKFDLPFKYYCIIDQNFVRERIELVREIVSRDLTLYVFPEVLRYIMQGIAQDQIRCRICVIEMISERAYQRSAAPAVLKRIAAATPDVQLLDAKLGLGYSFDASLGVFDADTVAYAALQVLVSGGAKQVYVHGLDLTVQNGLRFYGEGDRPQTSRLTRNFTNLIEPSFRFAAEQWRARGVSVFNLSPVSALSADIIERLDWQAFLKEDAHSAP
ncbi:lipopolysaccharide core biosynthesis protein [compost metagenome]